ncbi:MAG: N-acyl homoserine lactonase family protein [bacterium]
MRFYVLNTGYLKTDKNNVVANSTVCTRRNPVVTHEFYNLPVMCILIKHDNGYILYDTGSNPDAMKGYWPESLQDAYEFHQKLEERLEIQLALCGVQAEDIDTVIVSHMHFDHTGNLHLFKHADVYVPKADFMAAQTDVRLSAVPTTFSGYCKGDMDVLVKQYHLVEDDFEIVPGVEIINLPGHTPGLLGLIIHGEKDGTFIFPMDAVYTQEIYGPPAKASGLLCDRAAYFKSIETVRRLQKQYHATVIPAHDWDFFQTLRKAPEYYE